MLLCCAGVGWSADFKKGLDAAKKGDYATAMGEWRPLAERGDATAQFNLGWMCANGKGAPQMLPSIIWDGYTVMARAAYGIISMLICGTALPRCQDTRTQPTTKG